MKRPIRAKVFPIRLTVLQWRRYQRAANKQQRTLSDWIRVTLDNSLTFWKEMARR